MTTQELMNALHEHARGLRTPDVLVYDEKTGKEYEVVKVYEEDDYTCIDIRANEGITIASRDAH